MKSQILHLRWIVFLICIKVINCYSVSYIVEFIGHSESASVASAIVQNTAKVSTVIVPAGQTLTLTDKPVLVANSTTNESTNKDETNEKINLLIDFQGNSIVEF